MNGGAMVFEKERMKGPAGFFTRLVVDVVDTLSMVWDWFTGRFDWSPTRLLVAAILGILYLVSPIDIIPDFIPLAGWIDDLMVATVVFRLARFDLERYRQWKEEMK